MSGETPLVRKLTGFMITITNQNTDEGEVIHESELIMSRVGGAHIERPKDLVMMIEDAVFTACMCNENSPTFEHAYQDDGDPRCIHCNKPA